MIGKLFLTFGEGILAFISPCVLPLLPMYLSFFSGEYIKDTKYDKKKTLKGLLGFVLGFTIIFIILGASATFIGKILLENSFILKKVSGILIIILGFFYLDFLKLKFLNKDYKFTNIPTSPTFLKTILFGIIFALGWTPCIGPFVSSAIFLAGTSETLISGMVLLLSFSLGLSLPLIISALLFNQLISFFAFIKKHYKAFKIVSGIVLIITGILIFIGFI